MNNPFIKSKNILDTASSKSFFAVIATKYRFLLTIIGLFFVLILIVSGFTYYLADRSERAVTELDLIARQNVIAHELSEDVYNLNIYLTQTMLEKGVETEIRLEDLPQKAIYRIESINQNRDIFEKTVQALGDNGGKVEFADGTVIEIDGIQSDYLLNYVKNIESLWNPYLGLLENLEQETKTGVFTKETSNYLVEYSRLYGHNLQFEIDNLHQGVSYFIQEKANQISIVQFIGSVFAFLLFFGLIFGALRRLVVNDRLLEKARQETTEIMQTVNTGLFLLDKNLNLGNQYSKALEKILGTDRLAGETLSSVLRNRISDKDLQTTEEFITQLYNPRVKEKLVDSLNPLHKVMIYDGTGDDGRYLDFKFSRVYEDKNIARILVNVNDVSEAVRLEQRLEKERAENDMQIEMLTTILNVKPALFNDFINNTFNRIEKMNNILKNPGSSQFELEGKLKAIYREMHSLKGEASALKLHSFTKIASKAEEKLHLLQNESRLVGNDFLSLTIYLDELLNLSNTISKLGSRINSTPETVATPAQSQTASHTQVHSHSHHQGEHGVIDTKTFNHNYGLQKEDAKTQLGDYLVEFGLDIAKRQHKAVDINVSKMVDTVIPPNLYAVVKEISIQLLRNAIVHGVDDAESRLQKGKSNHGTVSIIVKNTSNDFVFAVEDDGKGIDYDAIRQKLLATNQYTAEQVQGLNQQQLLTFLFSSGFSTRKVADEDGGRGVGLDIIKERVKEYGGKMSVQSEKDKFTRFIIKLPVQSP